MPKSNDQLQTELLEQIKRLLMLSRSEQGIQGKRIASVLDIDPAVVSRILSVKKGK